MIKVAVSGAMGRLGNVIAQGVARADDMQLSAVYDPFHAGAEVAGMQIETAIDKLDAEMVVECTHPDVVMQNLERWHAQGKSVVVGTSGFSAERIEQVKSLWANPKSACLIVPNFSIGAVLMMRFAELASPYFDSAEVIERHEDIKPDAPSGTALATAMRMGAVRKQTDEKASNEIAKGARGGLVNGVRVHSLRMKGLLSDQEVAFSNLGETFSLNHRSTSYESFANGALVAIRYTQTISGVAVGLDAALGL